MSVLRKLVAVTVAAGALALSVGVVQAQAEPVSGSIVTPLGGGQGNWPQGGGQGNWPMGGGQGNWPM